MIYLVDRKETAAAGYFAASVSEVLKSHVRHVFITKFSNWKSFWLTGKLSNHIVKLTNIYAFQRLAVVL